MKCPDCQGEVMEIRGGYYCTKCGNKVDLEQIKLQLEAKVAQAKEKAQEQLGKVDDSANMFASKYEDLPQPSSLAENQFSETNSTQSIEGEKPQNLAAAQKVTQAVNISKQNTQEQITSPASQTVNPLSVSESFNESSEETIASAPIKDNLIENQAFESMPEAPQLEEQTETKIPEPPEPEVVANSSSVAQNMSPEPENILRVEPAVSSAPQVDSPEPPVPVSANIPQVDLSQAKVEMSLNQKNHLLGSLKAKILLIAVIIINILIIGAIIYFLVLKND